MNWEEKYNAIAELVDGYRRERDEARADLARSVAAWESAGMQGRTAHDAMLALAKERDEARAEYADARASRWHIIKERDALMDEVDRLSESAKAAWDSECFMRNERDEARAEVERLREALEASGEP